jgi:hypothetical protein
MKRQAHEQMLSLYNQWQASGERKTDFAISQGIRPTTFYYWIKKFEQGEPGSASGFRRIPDVDTFNRSQGELLASIHYPSGIRVELHGSFQDFNDSHVHLLKALTEPARASK